MPRRYKSLLKKGSDPLRSFTVISRFLEDLLPFVEGVRALFQQALQIGASGSMK